MLGEVTFRIKTRTPIEDLFGNECFRHHDRTPEVGQVSEVVFLLPFLRARSFDWRHLRCDLQLGRLAVRRNGGHHVEHGSRFGNLYLPLPAAERG